MVIRTFKRLSREILGVIPDYKAYMRKRQGYVFDCNSIRQAENDAQLVISPCRGISPITSAARLYRSFHDLLMNTPRMQIGPAFVATAATPVLMSKKGCSSHPEL